MCRRLKIYYSFNYSQKILQASEVLSGQLLLLFTSSCITLTPRGPLGTKCPPSNLPLIVTHTLTHLHTYTQTHGGRIVLIYPASSINHIISNNCHRQLGSQLRDFILIDFRTCSQLWMIWFPSDTMFIKGILHKGINRYCWLDLYELGKNAEIRPLF